jgi:hypothetical protein
VNIGSFAICMETILSFGFGGEDVISAFSEGGNMVPV